MAHPLLVSLRPQSIVIACHSHSHSHFELKLNSNSPRVLSLVRAIPRLQASASHSHLLDDLHHTPPPSNKDDSGIETKGVAARFGKLNAHKLKLIARKAKQQLNKRQQFREEEEEEEAEKEPSSRNSDDRGVYRTSRHDTKPRKSDSKTAGTHISSSPLKSHLETWGCTDFMIESLKGQVFVRPSHIQAKAFAPVIDGKTCVIADQSGSGKTLAYLIPLIQRLRQEELQGLGQSSPQSPRIVILVPNC
ncbi:hypothetical protein OIU84_018369 [Salix udensis]|uniref:DEAD/DEAH-box helicase domain-containing protein n=1 Tax=Salix udensis TaxID=889485 RepID=A0AAD6KY66_9ROSI|nr:hypothetical protein OIU84_018369 [Salix udensis]